MILAIDPGCIESAYVVLNENDLSVIESGKVENEKLLLFITYLNTQINHIVIEMVASYGMAVGREVFETVFWIGRFWEEAQKHKHCKILKLYRKEEKMNLCGSMKAKDSNVIQALIDRFAYNVPNKGKGTKKSPGWFYGVSKDIWQAYAVGVTYHDLYLNNPNLIQNATQDKPTQ
jgi:hypothetical protein